MMNKDNAKEFLPLLQALIDGKTIQYYSHTAAQWKDMAAVNFVYERARYRIKPERIKKKMWYKAGSVSMYDDAYFINVQDWEKLGWQLVDVEFDVP